jgi:hypothetical protein
MTDDTEETGETDQTEHTGETEQTGETEKTEQTGETGHHLSRRAMLALIGGGVGAVVVGGVVVLRSDDDSGSASDPLREPLPDDPHRLEGIVQVGERYRELVPEEATRAALLAAIPMSEELPETAEALEEELGAQRDQIRTDFDSGDVIDVDGWQFSRTEARLAALISLE